MAKAMKTDQLHELLYQALETEQGGITVYRTALRCVQHPKLREEWQEYLEQTQNHEQVVRKLFEAFELDPEAETPGRQVVRHIGASLVKAMEMALEAGPPEAAQLVAAECVVAGRDEGPSELGAARSGGREGQGRRSVRLSRRR